MDIFKILVTGHYYVGKTTFIRQLSDQDVVSTEGWLTEEGEEHEIKIALDFGRLTVAKSPNLNVLYFFGDPSDKHLPISQYPILFHPSRYCGIVIILNSILRTRDIYLKELIASFRQSGYPFVIGRNRWNIPGTIPLDKFKAIWGLNENDPIVLCNPTNRVEVCDTLLELFKQMPIDEGIQKLVEKIQELRALGPTQPEQPDWVSFYPTWNTHALDFIKIYVTGQVQANSLAFLCQISEIDLLPVIETRAMKRSTSIEFYPLETPIQLSFGRLTVDCETELYLFSDQETGKVPEATQNKCPVLLSPPEQTGVVVLVNTADPDSISAARSILHDLRHGPFPYLIAVNGDTQSIRETLQLNDQEITVACDPQNRTEVCAALIDLIALMPAYPFSPRIIEAIRALQS